MYLHEVVPLLVHLGIDLFGDTVDIAHEFLDAVKGLLALLDDLIHLVDLNLSLLLLCVVILHLLLLLE